MRIFLFGILILLISTTWTIVKVEPNDGRTMLADGGIITVVKGDGTVKTCTQIGSGPTSVLICN